MTTALTDAQLEIQHLRLEVARLQSALCDAKMLTALLKVPAVVEAPVRVSLRQRDVLARLIEGDSNEQIGEHLYLTENTVRNHMARLTEKFGTRSRTALAIAALRQGIVPLTPKEPTHA